MFKLSLHPSGGRLALLFSQPRAAIRRLGASKCSLSLRRKPSLDVCRRCQAEPMRESNCYHESRLFPCISAVVYDTLDCFTPRHSRDCNWRWNRRWPLGFHMAFEARLNVDPTPKLLFLWLRVALDCELKVEIRPCGQNSDLLQDSFEYVDGA